MAVSGIITAIIFGLIIGALGRLAVPGKQHIPIWLTLLIGVVGALLGTVLAKATGLYDGSGWSWVLLLFQVIVAALGVFLVAGIGSSRRRRLTR